MPSLFRDRDASSDATDAAADAVHRADRDTSDAAKEARLLSQLLLHFSVKRHQHLQQRLDSASDDGSMEIMEPPPTTRSVHIASHSIPLLVPATLDAAQLHPSTDAARASSLLRSKPSERELIHEFLLLPVASRNKVAQSLFVIPPSLLDDFANVLQFFVRVLLEAHSDSRCHHYVEQSHEQDEQDEEQEAARRQGASEKTCSWAKNSHIACVTYEQDDASASTSSDLQTPSTTAVFALPPGFHTCLVETYGSVQRTKCEEVWHGDHMAYRCRTCGLSDSSCMCLACFDPSDHEGHDYRVYRCSSGGCCDCGDPLAWKPNGFCKKHKERAATADEMATQATMGALEHEVVYGLVRRVVAFCIHVLREVYLFCLRPGGATSSSMPYDGLFSPPAVRALPKTGRRRSSFPSVMQVHLDRLQQSLAWLQALATSCVPYRQIVTDVFLECVPPEFQLEPPPPSSTLSTAENAPPSRRPRSSRVILDVFLQAGVLLPVDMCDTLGVLYLKLLFDQPFKQKYTCHFVDWYPYFIDLYLSSSDENNEDGMRSLSRFIDRLFCQLFHSTAQLNELERTFHEREQGDEMPASKTATTTTTTSVVETLLVFLLEKLIGLFKSTVRVEATHSTQRRSDGRGIQAEREEVASLPRQVVDCGRNLFKKRVYARLCSDIRTLLVHPLVAGQVLLGSLKKTAAAAESSARSEDEMPTTTVYALLIHAFECLQQMDLQQRHVDRHIEFESQNWTFAFVVDYEMNLLLSAFLAGVPYCFAPHGHGEETVADGEEPSRDKYEVACALIAPLRRALEKWGNIHTTSSWQQSTEEAVDNHELLGRSYFRASTSTLSNSNSTATKKSSFHLPLHHMFAAFFQGICAVVEPQSLDDWRRLLFSSASWETETTTSTQVQHSEQQTFLTFLLQHPLDVCMLAREIKSGLWVRNGNVMWQQLVHYYAKHWRFYGLHGDLFVCQLSALLLPRGRVTRELMDTQVAMAQKLMTITPSSSCESSRPSRQETELLEEVLRLVSQLVLAPILRFPTTAASHSLEDMATWRLEREMMHWLSLGPYSRSEVVAHVDMKLVEQVRQLPRHEWYLQEEEEIVSHVLERVGEYFDPCVPSTASAGGGGGDTGAAATTAAAATATVALGFGMKMSGSWRLKQHKWREISPLFECFSPSEAQQCEQNLKKEQLRTRTRVEDCLLPVPREGDHNFASAQALTSQLLNCSSLVGVVVAVMSAWRREDRRGSGSGDDAGGDDRQAAVRESLVVAAVQCLYIATQLVDDSGTLSIGQDLPRDVDTAGGGGDDGQVAGIIHELGRLTTSNSGDFYLMLCKDVAVPVSADGGVSMESVLSLLLAVASPQSSLSSDAKALANAVVATATHKSLVCHKYVETKQKIEKQAQQQAAATAAPRGGGSDDKQQIAKEMMRRRQQEIMEKMRSQQNQFMSSQSGSSRTRQEENASREAAHLDLDADDDSQDDEEDADGDSGENGEDVYLSTEYEDDDEDEEDEWGFPTGHIDLELYLSHVSSAISLVCDRERRVHQRQHQQRRLRRRAKSRVSSSTTSERNSSEGLSVMVDQAENGDAASIDEDDEECALCRLPCDPRDLESPFGYVAMIQPTCLPQKLVISAEFSQLPPVPATGSTTHERPTAGGDVVMWSCGHAVHQACITAYVDSLWARQPPRNPLDALTQRGDDRLLSERDLEFTCPICRRLSNCLLPNVQVLLQPTRDSQERQGSDRQVGLRRGESVEDRESQPTGHIAGREQPTTRCSFTQWLATAMEEPLAIGSLSASEVDTVDASTAVQARIHELCIDLTQRSVRAARQLPLLLSAGGGALGSDNTSDEREIDTELRDLATTWRTQFTNVQLLLRCLEVEMDVTLADQELTTRGGATGPLDRHRMRSLRLLGEIAVAATVFDGGHMHELVAATSDVLFGRRVLFADGDEDEGDGEDGGGTTPADVPLLSHPHLYSVFNARATALQGAASAVAMAASGSSSQEDYRFTEELLTDVLYTARVVVTAQILQALCSAVTKASSPPAASGEMRSPPRSPVVSSTRTARATIITDFDHVETLSDAAEWAQQLMVRSRLLPPSTCPCKRSARETTAMDAAVVDAVLPVVRKVVLWIQVSLPHLLGDSAAGGGGEEELCGLCDELSTADQQIHRMPSPARDELNRLLRLLHLPPLRLFFRRFVFAPRQRELCQLWAAQMETKAAVLRRRDLQRQLERHASSPQLAITTTQSSLLATKLLVPTIHRHSQQRRRGLFIDLPKVYMDFFIKYNDKPLGVCQRCHQLPQHPAICLFCGDVLCCFSSCCESAVRHSGSSSTTASGTSGRVGECTQHAQTCGLGTCAFLLLRACTVILFLGNDRRCVWGSLYVDKNGEEDPYLRRGKTLFLAENRLLALEMLLVSHGFPQNTAILANTSRRDGKRY